jgi:hypothetical protein
MADDTITSSWKRFTDEVSGPRGEPADDHFAEVASAPFLQDKDGAHRAALLRLAELRSSVGHLLLAWPGAYKGDDSVTVNKGP